VISQAHSLAAAEMQIKYRGTPQDIIQRGVDNRNKQITGEAVKITPQMRKLPELTEP